MDHIVQDGKQKISDNEGYGEDNKVSLDYDKAIHCIRGPDVTIYDSSKYTNVTDAVRDALHNITDRQATKRGVTILCNGLYTSDIRDIINTVTEGICYCNYSCTDRLCPPLEGI